MTALKFWDNTLQRFPVLKQFAANPVVLRDLRAQMRGPRSYWYIGGYLLLLGVLAVAGYAQATGQNLNPVSWSQPSRNIVDAQANLEGFYYFIFMTLALLITLIAPALTAASVVGERQRQSFDLLVTTPLSAGHLLIGKLMSSIAFLGLLLVLSLPASALCILLGGATIGDVFRIYFLLTVDGIVLSAIGLYFSCAVRVPLLATIWTYLSVAGFFVVSVSFTSLTGGTTPYSLFPAVSLLWLNPISATIPIMGGSDGLWTLLERLAVFVVVSGLFVRLLLTAATYRLGLFGAHSGVSLRKQTLVFTGVVTYLLSNGMAPAHGPQTVTNEMGLGNAWLTSYGILIAIVFAVALPFLPGLFVPANAEDAPPGATQESAEEPNRHRLFVWSRLFRPEHAGALPWYVAFVATVTVAMLAGMPWTHEHIMDNFGMVLSAGWYILALGVMTWGLSRLAASIIPELSPARAAAFGLFVAAMGAPLLLWSMLHSPDWKENPFIMALCLFSPLSFTNNAYLMMDGMLRTGCVAMVIGVIVVLCDNYARASRRNVLPAARVA